MPEVERVNGIVHRTQMWMEFTNFCNYLLYATNVIQKLNNKRRILKTFEYSQRHLHAYKIYSFQFLNYRLGPIKTKFL